MGNRRDRLKILLMQIRNDDVTRLEELGEFVRYSGLAPEQFTVLDVFERPSFASTCMEGYDALFVGGSSDASVLEPDQYPFVEDAKRLLVYCLDQRIPVFASCFGFQVVVEALGGKVILDREQMEIGSFAVDLTPSAQEDLLLHDTPSPFWAICGHQERAASLPQGAIHLASTELCPYHAFKMEDKPFYAFQFHPEVDKQDLVARITRYKDRYLNDEEMLQNILSDIHDTPESNELIRKFVDRILLGGSP
jgi:GMP synthase (glutamine-hydrolysing)